MNNSPIRNEYKFRGILVLKCIPFSVENSWIYLQSNIPLLYVGMRQVPGEIPKIIQAKCGNVV